RQLSRVPADRRGPKGGGSRSGRPRGHGRYSPRAGGRRFAGSRSGSGHRNGAADEEIALSPGSPAERDLAARAAPLQPRTDVSGDANLGVQPPSQRRSASGPLAPDDSRPPALEPIHADPRVSRAHAGRAQGWHHSGRGSAFAQETDRLRP